MVRKIGDSRQLGNHPHKFSLFRAMPGLKPTPPYYVIRERRFEIMLQPDAIQARVAALADELNTRFEGQEPVIVPILTGALPFFADLLPRLTVAYELSPIKLSSYGEGMTSQGPPTVPDLPVDPAGKPLIVLEDIIETGRTYQALLQALRLRGAASVFAATLLLKKALYTGEPPDWVGFEISDAFVIGYGLDFAEKGRHLRGIYQLVG